MAKITPQVLSKEEEVKAQGSVNPEANAESVAQENTEAAPQTLSKSEKKRLAEIERARKEEEEANAELDKEEVEQAKEPSDEAKKGVSTEVEKNDNVPAEEGSAPQEEITMKKIISADNRQLEVSIGNEVWKGFEIMVPSNLEGEIRRILHDGGFYVKN